MAAQVLSGSGNVSYTNSTGQNVRLVINYLETATNVSGNTTVSFPGNTITLSPSMVYGKTLAWKTTSSSSNHITGSMAESAPDRTEDKLPPLPLELALANGDTFSITGNTSTNIKGYNMIIIPEAG